MVDKNIFPKGTYVVLESACDGTDYWRDQMPINHCYRLREDSHKWNFSIEKDMRGSSINGWTLPTSQQQANYLSKLSLRQATPEEKLEYFKRGGPYDISTIPKTFNSYDLY